MHISGDPDQNEALLQGYYNQAKPNDATAAALASLSCYLFWDAHWNRNYVQNKLIEFDENTQIGSGRVDHLWYWDESIDEEHTQWCKQYHINPTSVRSVTETVESVLNVLFQSKCEPDFLRATDPTPLWKREVDWTGIPFEGKQMFLRVYGPGRSHFLCRALTILYEKSLRSTGTQRCQCLSWKYAAIGSVYALSSSQRCSDGMRAFSYGML